MGMSTCLKKQSIWKKHHVQCNLGNKWMATITGHKNLPYLYPMEAFQPVSMHFRRFSFPWILHSLFLFSWRLEHDEFFYVSPAPVCWASWLFVYIAWGLMTSPPRSPRFSCLVPVLNVRGHSIWRHVETTRNLPVCLRSKFLCGIQFVWGYLCCRRKSCAENSILVRIQSTL